MQHGDSSRIRLHAAVHSLEDHSVHGLG
jgi:hypothetical protein